jgi:hypothetical protein
MGVQGLWAAVAGRHLKETTNGGMPRAMALKSANGRQNTTHYLASTCAVSGR